MNYKNLVLSLGLAAATSGFASAQTAPVLFSESRVVFNFTLEYQVPNLKPKDSQGKTIAGIRRTTNEWYVEKSSKAVVTDTYVYNELGQSSVKVRYGNREILEDLVAEGEIESSVGWYISVFSNPQGQPVAIYARHATLGSIPLDDYISMSNVAVPSLEQRPTDPDTDPDSVANAVDTYSYSGNVRNRVATDTDTFFTKGVRKTISVNGLTIDFPERFPTPLSGLVRLTTESNVNNGGAFPPTWIVKSIKSSAVILAGERTVRNEVNQEVDIHVLAEGTITGSAGVVYTDEDDLPEGVDLGVAP